MTRDDAVKLVKAVHKLAGAESPGLNEKGFGGLMLGLAQLYFEHTTAQSLVCRAHVFSLPREATPALLAALEEEGQGQLGGGAFEYLPENRGLFLTRAYDVPLDEQVFLADIQALGLASLAWRKDVLPTAFERARATS